MEEHVKIGSKTTMRIGGTARWYGEIVQKKDVDQAYAFAKEQNLPLIILGGGSNTIFADTEVNAVVCRMKNDAVTVDGNTVTAQTGKLLPVLVNDLAAQGLDFSTMTGILGTVGGAVFGNAGQGAKGIWLDTFIKDVTFFVDGEWKTWTKEQCNFRYRESGFKDMPTPPIIWEVTLEVPSKPSDEIKAEVERLLKRRLETQPHIKTAGSCFKSLPDGTMAWQLIDAAGLRGTTVGGVQIAEKHANFLLNIGNGTFKDVLDMTELIKQKVPQIAGIEMRLYGEDGKIMH